MRPLVALMITTLLLGCARKDFDNPYDPKNAPPAPKLESPADGEITPDNPPWFIWAEVAGARSYQIEVDDDRDFGSAAVSRGLSSNRYRPYGCFGSSTYYWRVRAAGEKGVFGGWSPADSFSVVYPLLGACEVEGSFVHDVQVSGHFAYLVGWPFDLAVVDVSSPFSPSLVSVLELSDSDNAQRVLVEGDYVYVGDSGERVYVVDISDPAKPKEVGHCHLWGLRDISKTGHYLVCADGPWLRMVDVSDPEDPRHLAYYYGPDECYGVSARGEYAYGAFRRRGLQVVRLFDLGRSRPHLVGSCQEFEDAVDVFVRDNCAFVTDAPFGLKVADISDPSSPIIVGNCETPGARSVYVERAQALVGYSNDTVAIVNVSQPASPQIVGTFRPGGSVSRVFAEAGYAYLACGERGLQILRME